MYMHDVIRHAVLGPMQVLAEHDGIPLLVPQGWQGHM